MKLPKPTRREVAAFVAGVVALALVFAFLGLGPWRYTVTASASSQNSSVVGFVVDTWTGRVRVWDYGTEMETETVEQQRAATVERIQREASTVKGEDGVTRYLVDIGSYPGEVVEVAPRHLRSLVRKQPEATPANR